MPIHLTARAALLAIAATVPLAAQTTRPADVPADFRTAREWLARPAEDQVVARYGTAASVSYRRYTEPRPLRLWVARIDLDAPDVGISVTGPTDFTLDEDPDNDHFETRCADTLQFARETGVQLAVNTSAFRPFRDEPGMPMEVVGLAAHEGRVFSDPDPRFGVLHVARDGRVALKGPAGSDESVWTAVTGFRMLLDDRELVVDPAVAASRFGQLNPRTGIGVDRAGRRLWLVVADGRQPETSTGLTLVELAGLFAELGVWDALNMDGGGSSTLVLQETDSTHRVVNTPVGRGTPGSLRQVANNLGVRLPPRTPD